MEDRVISRFSTRLSTLLYQRIEVVSMLDKLCAIASTSIEFLSIDTQLFINKYPAINDASFD